MPLAPGANLKGVGLK